MCSEYFKSTYYLAYHSCNCHKAVNEREVNGRQCPLSSHAQQCGWAKAAFWDFPLTPHKVRTEQEQKAGRKHFKLHGRKTERGCCSLRQAATKQHRSAGETDQKRQRGPRRGDRIITPLSKTINQTSMSVCTHARTTTQTDNETWKHLKCHLRAARQTLSESAQQDIDILPTHTQHGEELGLSLCVSQFGKC